MKQWISTVLAALSLMVLSSCSSSSEIIATGLKIEVNRIARAADGSVEVTWQLGNPNVVPYVVDRVAHKLSLDGAEVGTFSDDSRFGVPKQGREERTSLLKLATGGGDRIAQAVGRSASYQIDTTVWLLIVDDDFVKASLKNSGSVAVTAK